MSAAASVMNIFPGQKLHTKNAKHAAHKGGGEKRRCSHAARFDDARNFCIFWAEKWCMQPIDGKQVDRPISDRRRDSIAGGVSEEA
jgi:hypothetical protein